MFKLVKDHLMFCFFFSCAIAKLDNKGISRLIFEANSKTPVY